MKKLSIIDFNLKTREEVEKVKDNTYNHCNFEKLAICGLYTPVGYFRGV
ncbi:MAG: hypothetical protein A4E25_00052 [Methanobacterium sp. PtaB.Bin024]|nr:MAG: hypothetical protein A4E25_00052 [Methanobacterium sp. PtaB.Bin024]